MISVVTQAFLLDTRSGGNLLICSTFLFLPSMFESETVVVLPVHLSVFRANAFIRIAR